MRHLSFLHDNLIIKDPIACMASKYLKQAYRLKTVMLVRHPAAYCASAKRLSFDSPLDSLLRQKELVDDYLGPILRGVHLQSLSPIESHALVWKCLYYVMHEYVEEGVYDAVERHEDLSSVPVGRFKFLYDRLALAWTPEVEAKIRLHTGDGNPVGPTGNKPHVLKRDSRANIARWRSVLSDKEVESIRVITEDVSSHYYQDSDW